MNMELGCANVGFRSMAQVMAVMGMWVAMISGVTTGALTALETNFGLSTFEMGWVIVSFDIGAVVAATPCGYLGAHNPPKWIGAGMVVGGVAVFLFGCVSNLFLFSVTQILAGAGATIIWILGCIHIDNNVNCKAVASDYTGWLMALAPFGVIGGLMLAGGFLGGCSESSEGTNDCTNSSVSMVPLEVAVPEVLDCDQWRWPFWILGCCLVPWGFWFFFSKRFYPTPKNATCCGAIDYLPEGEWNHQRSDGLKSFAHFCKGMKCLMTNPRYLLITMGAIIHLFQSTAIIAFGPRYIEKQLCVKRSQASLLTGTLIPMISFGSYMGGYIPMRMGWGVGHSRKPMLMMAVTTLTALPFALLSFSLDSVAGFLCIISVSLTFAFVMSVPAVTSVQRVVPVEYRGLAVGVQSLAARVLGAIPGPLVMGVLLDDDRDLVTPWKAYAAISLSGLTSASLMWFLAWYLQIHHDHVAIQEQQAEQYEKEQAEQMATINQQPLLVPTNFEGMIAPPIVQHI